MPIMIMRPCEPNHKGGQPCDSYITDSADVGNQPQSAQVRHRDHVDLTAVYNRSFAQAAC